MKNALITGANKGVGFETARELLRHGYFVYLGSRSLENGEAAKQKLLAEGLDKAKVVPLDVTNPASVERARDLIGREADHLDVLVNNAGINGGLPQTATTAGIDQFQRTLDVNLYGVVRMTQAFLDLIRRSAHPRIVNVSSSGCSLSLQSDPTYLYYHHKGSVYTASKAAMNMYTINLAYELRDTPVKVNAVCPGFVATDFNNHRGTGTVEEGGRRIAKYALIGDDGPTGTFIAEDYNPATGEVPW